MIKTIFFDLGGVVFTDGATQFIEELSSEYAVDKEQIRDVISGDLGSQYRTGKISRDAFWEHVLKTLQINANVDDLETQWVNGYELIQGTKDILVELSKKYEVYYLSDNVKDRVDKLNKKYSFKEWFNGGIFSHEVGVRKPHPDIYKFALEKANVTAYESIFIDDKPSALPPAKELGMKTILFESPEQLRTDLQELGLL